MFGGSLIAAAVNYLYYPTVGRLVSTSQFGEIQALVSVSLQIGLFLGVVADVTVNVVANSEPGEDRNRIVFEFGRLATLIMAAFVIIALCFVQQLKHFLHFIDAWPFALLGIVLVISASSTMRSAYLRGVHAFTQLSFSTFVGALSKLLASLVLVLIGFGTMGAIGGLVISQIISLAYIVRSTRKLGLHAPKEDTWLRLPDLTLIKPELSYAGLVLIVSLMTTVLFSIDVVLAKHYFSAQVAGEYAGIATIGRIIYFLTGSVSVVLLSAVKRKASRQANRALLLRSLLITLVFGGSALIAFYVAPRFFIQLLIGHRYLPLAGLLPRLSLTLFVISIINLIFSYDVALRRWSIAVISVIGIILTAGFVALHHGTPTQLVDSLLLGSVILLGMRLLDSVRRNVLLMERGLRSI